MSKFAGFKRLTFGYSTEWAHEMDKYEYVGIFKS